MSNEKSKTEYRLILKDTDGRGVFVDLDGYSLDSIKTGSVKLNEKYKAVLKVDKLAEKMNNEYENTKEVLSQIEVEEKKKKPDVKKLEKAKKELERIKKSTEDIMDEVDNLKSIIYGKEENNKKETTVGKT